MPNWAIYDTTTNAVKDFIVSSPHDPTYPVGAGEGAVKDPEVSLVTGIPLKYWKHAAGSIVLMTAQEQSDVDAAEAARIALGIRASAKEKFDGFIAESLVMRAFADIVKDEINALRQWLTTYKAQVALATNLANLQTRVAAFPDLPDRTLDQLKTAIQSRVDSGLVD